MDADVIWNIKEISHTRSNSVILVKDMCWLLWDESLLRSWTEFFNKFITLVWMSLSQHISCIDDQIMTSNKILAIASHHLNVQKSATVGEIQTARKSIVLMLFLRMLSSHPALDMHINAFPIGVLWALGNILSTLNYIFSRDSCFIKLLNLLYKKRQHFRDFLVIWESKRSHSFF